MNDLLKEHNRTADLLSASFRRSAETCMRNALHYEEHKDGRVRRRAINLRKQAADWLTCANKALTSKILGYD